MQVSLILKKITRYGTRDSHLHEAVILTGKFNTTHGLKYSTGCQATEFFCRERNYRASPGVSTDVGGHTAETIL